MNTWIKTKTLNGFSYKCLETNEVIDDNGILINGLWDELKNKIDNSEVIIVNLEDTAAHKINIRDSKIEECLIYWASEENKDIVFNLETFSVNFRTYVFCLGQIQAANFYELINGAGTWAYNWTLKNGNYYAFDLNSIYLFGMDVAVQVENSMHNKNEHTKNIMNINLETNSASDIEAYDFTVSL